MQVDNPLVSVVIPIYISKNQDIDMTLSCIRNAKYYCDYDNVEWIIVETCSDYFIKHADVYIHEQERTTPSISINKGFACSRGDYVVLLSSDVIVGEKWLSSLLDCFLINDCGLSTLGTEQFGNKKENSIVEFVYFPIAMIPRKYCSYDERFDTCFNDTDVVMRAYIDGKKMYQNMNSIVKHLCVAAHGTNNDKYNENRAKFREKYQDYKDTDIYKLLA